MPSSYRQAAKMLPFAAIAKNDNVLFYIAFHDL
jgi:hypothetical protein